MALSHEEYRAIARNAYGHMRAEQQQAAMQNAFGQSLGDLQRAAAQNAYVPKRTYKDDIEDMERDLKLLLRIE